MNVRASSSVEVGTEGTVRSLRPVGAPSSRPDRWGGMRFMVIEDDTLQAIDLESLLVDMGHTVVAVAQHPDSAQRQLDRLRGEVDCAVLDLDLAGQTSVAFAEELRQRKIPFLFVTGHAPEDVAALGLDCVVIEKPYTLNQLRAGLRRTLG